MTTNHIIKIKDDRIWRARYYPTSEGKPNIMFEDVTLEVANIIRKTMSGDVQGVFKPAPERPASEFD